MLRALSAVSLCVAMIACVTQPVYTGTVKAVGSEPHVQLILVTEHERYELVGELALELWQWQQQQVSVHGTVVREAGAPGIYAQLEVESIASSSS